MRLLKFFLALQSHGFLELLLRPKVQQLAPLLTAVNDLPLLGGLVLVGNDKCGSIEEVPVWNELFDLLTTYENEVEVFFLG